MRSILAPFPIPPPSAQDEAADVENVLDTQEEQVEQALEKLAIYGPWRAAPVYPEEPDRTLLGGDDGDATSSVDLPASLDPYIFVDDEDGLLKHIWDPSLVGR